MDWSSYKNDYSDDFRDFREFKNKYRDYAKENKNDLSELFTDIGEEFDATESKTLTEEEILINKIKKIKRIIDDDVYDLVGTIVNNKNKKLAKLLQGKLEYLGINWYNKINITNTIDLNQLKKDMILSFINLNFDLDTDLEKYKFVMTKIKQFQEWEDFFDE